MDVDVNQLHARARDRSGHVVGVVILERAARRSEHAHIVSKWRPIMNLATECSENVCSEYGKLRENDGSTDLRAIKWSRFISRPR